MLFTPKPLATRSTGCAPTITYKVEYGIRANHIQELGREQKFPDAEDEANIVANFLHATRCRVERGSDGRDGRRRV